MSKRYKFYTLGILTLIVLPISTAFCCCIEPDANQSRQELLGHSHHDSSGHDHGSHHHDGKEGSPESCECGNEVLASLVNKSPVDFAFLNGFTKIHYASSALEETLLDSESSPPSFFHDAGPPGIHFLSNPRYLISLRI